MTDLKQLFGSYNICARFAPGFLFVLALYFLFEYDIKYLESNVIFIVLFVILSALSGFISAAIIKIIEQFIWQRFGNPTICYLKSQHKNLYKTLLLEHKKDKQIMLHILAITRGDSKLFWKTISYGFFRNSILLSLICLFFSWETKYFSWNVGICLGIIFMIFISTYYYAHQAIESYQESKCNKMNKV